jgi:hypothetical protein
MNSTPNGLARQDRLEQLFSSNDPRAVLRFFDEIRDPSDFLQFSNSRPRARIAIHKINFDKLVGHPDLIVVVPTANIESQLVQNLARQLSPLPMVVVESSGKFFNFSVSMNLGISVALQYGPEHVMISNDDVIPVSSAQSVIETVQANRDCDVIVPGVQTPQCSYTGRFYILLENALTRLATTLASEFTKGLGLAPVESSRRLGRKLLAFSSRRALRFFYFDETQMMSHRKSGEIGSMRLPSPLFQAVLALTEHLGPLPLLQPVSFVRSSVFQSFRFDEAFINSGEDRELSLRLVRSGRRFRLVDLRFQTVGGATLVRTQAHINRGLTEHLYLGSLLLRSGHEAELRNSWPSE